MYGTRWGQLLGNRTGVAAGTSDQAWDPAVTEGPLVLSANDCVVVVQAPGAVAGDGTKGTISQGTGKVYWEIVLFSDNGGSDATYLNVGLIDESDTVGTSSLLHTIIASISGSIYGNDDTIGGWVIPAVSDVICLYADLDERLFYVRLNGSDWHGESGAGPSIDDVTGVDISYLGPMVFPYADIRMDTGGCIVARFSPSLWQFAPPPGASEWIGGGAPAGGDLLGDIVGGAVLYWGLRAYDNATATAGDNAITIVATDAVSLPVDVDVPLLPDGTLDLSVIDIPTAHAPYSLKTLYDQVGSNNAIPAAGSWDWAPTDINGVPGALFGASFTGGAVIPFVVSQPFSVIFVVRNDYDGADHTLIGANPAGVHISYKIANPDELELYAGGSTIDYTPAPDDAYHSVQILFDGASSKVSVDGAVPVSIVVEGDGSTVDLHLGMHAGFAGFMQGGMGEFAIYPGDVVTANYAAIYANHAAYFGV